jgi:hypothetical protein
MSETRPGPMQDNPMLEFIQKDPIERLRYLETFLRDPVWLAIDSFAAAQAVVANQEVIEAEDAHKAAKAAGRLKAYIAIREQPMRLAHAARMEAEGKKAEKLTKQQ